MASIVTLRVTSTQSLPTGYNCFLIDAAGDNLVLTLPNINADGANYSLKRMDSSVNVNTVTVQGFNPSQTIDGATSMQIVNDQSCKFVAFEDVWYNGRADVPIPSVGNYVSAFDTSSQGIDVANTFQTLTFSNTSAFNSAAILNGWTYSAGVFTCHQTGVYQITYSAASIISLLTGTSSARIIKNGTEISGSQSFIGLTTTLFGILSRNFITSVASGDTIEFQVTGTAVTISIVPGGSGGTPVSAALTIIRLS